MDVTSGKFAFDNDISLLRDYYSDEEYDNAKKVYYRYSSESELKLVALYFPDYYYSINCFPITFVKYPSEGTLWSVLTRNAFVLGYLNKDKDVSLLIEYLSIVYDNKYRRFNFKIDIEELSRYINYGKDKEDGEVEFGKKRYLFINNANRLNKKTKTKIMRNFEKNDIKTENFHKIRDEVNFLCMGHDFITPKLVSDRTHIHYDTVRNYIPIFKEDIDSHNLSIHGTSNYNDYLYKAIDEDIRLAIGNLRHKGKKVNVSNIAKQSGISRHTITKHLENKEL